FLTTKQFFIQLILLLLVSLILWGIQSLIVEGLKESFFFLYPVWKIYVFHFFVTLMVFSLLFMVGKLMPNWVGFSFMGLILVKIEFDIVFLMPLIMFKEMSKFTVFFSFIDPIFIFLILEIVMYIKNLKIFDYKFTTVYKNEKNKSV